MELIAALATPPGASALGVLRLSGDGARAAGEKLLRIRSAEGWQPRKAMTAEALAGGEVLDEVVAVFFPGPGTATGEDLLEISAHGSPLILRRLLAAAFAAGARPAAPGEFTQRGFLNGRLDLSQAEAVGELIGARTEEARRRALRQLRGGLSDEIARLRRPLLELLVRLEAGLDHPEEDLPPLARGSAAKVCGEISRAARRLAETYRDGRLTRDGARLAILGRPNAGKSSLLNALLGRDRAIVCPTPGTTRDTIEEPWEVDGAPALLIDTAGLGETPADPAEKAGMERSLRALEGADLAILVVDRSKAPAPEDEEVHARIAESAFRLGTPLLRVLNKCDLPPLRPEDSIWEEGPVAVSALTGLGLERLHGEISRGLSLEKSKAEPILIASQRHAETLLGAALALAEAEGAADGTRDPHLPWEDRTASSLRDGFRRLGEIVGEGTPEQVLHEIFSRFCIGK